VCVYIYIYTHTLFFSYDTYSHGQRELFVKSDEMRRSTVVDILASSGNVTLTLFLVLPLISICPYSSVYSLPFLSLLATHGRALFFFATYTSTIFFNTLTSSHSILVSLPFFIVCGRSMHLTFPLLQLEGVLQLEQERCWFPSPYLSSSSLLSPDRSIDHSQPETRVRLFYLII
jgi:hypothetical protein